MYLTTKPLGVTHQKVLRTFKELNSNPHTAPPLLPCNANITAPMNFCKQKSPTDSVFRFTFTFDTPATICCERGARNFRAQIRVLLAMPHHD